MKIAIIGGGASGLFAGGFLSDRHQVYIFDGNEKLGKKLYITGKGRCNVTNNCSDNEVIENIVHGAKFMMSSVKGFTPQDTINFFENHHVKLKTERGNRVFPQSDKSSDIIKALINHCQNCTIKLNEKVLFIEKQESGFTVKTSQQIYNFDKVIIATGGKSYPATGSSGDGYKFAKMFGHSIISPHSALVPIKLQDAFCHEVEGLSLKNVSLNACYDGKKKSLFGDMLFTYDGISGPIVLSLSSLLYGANNVSLSIDFKPALSEEKLEARLLRDFADNQNKNFKYILKGLLPNSIIAEFTRRLNIDENLKVNNTTKEVRKNLIKLLKAFPLKFSGLYPVESGIITAGGVDLKEVNPKTMESRLVSGLYFIGEVLDVDCFTGGFNLQVAFSTAYACAKYL